MARGPQVAGERLVEVGGGCWAWLQRDGGWGWSNAGLIVDHEATLLVDTLFDVALTRTMLDAMARAVPAASNIQAVVNTHANGDHCWGNQLVGDAVVVASEATAREMVAAPPEGLARAVRHARWLQHLPWPLSSLPAGGGATVGELSTYLTTLFGDFDFDSIQLRVPDRTFHGSLTWQVGDKAVELVEVGPCHTRGDTIVHVPDDSVVYTGDILFSSGHPIMWEGPVTRWIAACDRIEALAPERVVPGHGPLATLTEVRRCRDYLTWLTLQVRDRFDAGVGELDAALDLDARDWLDWGDGERIVANVHALYRELRGASGPPDARHVFGLMAAYKARR